MLKDDFVMIKLHLAFEHAILSQSTLATYCIKKMKHNVTQVIGKHILTEDNFKIKFRQLAFKILNILLAKVKQVNRYGKKKTFTKTDLMEETNQP